MKDLILALVPPNCLSQNGAQVKDLILALVPPNCLSQNGAQVKDLILALVPPNCLSQHGVFNLRYILGRNFVYLKNIIAI